MFCVECGKEGQIFKDGVCIDCYIKSHEFSKGPEVITIEECPHCNSYKYKNTWKNELLNKIIIRNVKHNFKISKELEKLDINPVCTEIKKGYDCTIIISGYIKDKEVSEEHPLEIRIKKLVCETCSKQFGGYHEAIIQIRTDKRKLSKKELEDIENHIISYVEKANSKGNNNLFITDATVEHGGMDFFISDKQEAMNITKKLQANYGGHIKSSSSNAGMKDSKQLFRVTYLLRLPDYKEGDYVEFKNNYYKIISTSSDKVKLLNLKNWEEKLAELRELDKIKVINDYLFEKEMIIVSQKEDEIQLMDPKSYKISIIIKPKKMDFYEEKIKILIIDEQFFLKK